MFLPPFAMQAPSMPGDLFALTFAAGHDLNDDRIPDLVIADATSLGDGVDVWFVSGRDGSVLGRWESRGTPGWVSVEFAGDVDCDGYSEIALAVISYQRPGRLEILSGRDRSVIRTISSEELGIHRLGRIRAAGDVDEDGSPDLIVCGMRTLDATCTEGRAVVVSGATGSVVWTATGAAGSGSASASSAGIGDVDADGRDDVAIRWWCERSRAPCVFLYSGRTGLPPHEILGGSTESDFGRSLDGGLDFDGDSRPDILIGSPDCGSPAKSSGRVRVFSGRDGSLLRTLDGINFPRVDAFETDQFGECARFMPDVDGDRVPEILVGSPEEGMTEGSAYLCSGRTGSILHAIEGKLACSIGGACEGDDYHTGRELAAAGDVDLDGTEDFVVGNVPYDRGQWGPVRVYSGRTRRLLLDLTRELLLQSAPPAPSTPR
jgi:hypothetical protein